jgi:hypothetical protein
MATDILGFQGGENVDCVIFWDVTTPCRLVGGYQCIGGTYHLHFQVKTTSTEWLIFILQSRLEFPLPYKIIYLILQQIIQS